MAAEAPSGPKGAAHDGERGNDHAPERERRQTQLTGMPVPPGKDYDIHAVVRSGHAYPLEYRQATQQIERTSQPTGFPGIRTRDRGCQCPWKPFFENTCALPATPLSWLSP